MDQMSERFLSVVAVVKKRSGWSRFSQSLVSGMLSETYRCVNQRRQSTVGESYRTFPRYLRLAQFYNPRLRQ